MDGDSGELAVTKSGKEHEKVGQRQMDWNEVVGEN